MIDGPTADPYQPYQPQMPPPLPPPPRNSSATAVFMAVVATICAIVLVASAVSVGIGLARVRAVHPSTSTVSPIRIVPQQTSGAGTGAGATDAQSIAQPVAKAIVDINTETPNGSAAGTGMVLTSSGEVLTNNHVIAGATSITVTLTSNSRIYRASVLGADPTADVALLQLQGASGLATVTVADSSTLSVGQSVVAIGNAGGRGGAPSVTSGTITALDQTITASDGNGPGEQLNGVIESDAPISPGDSGGALVNTSGQVIGMITAGQSRGFRRRSTTSVGYAITSTNAIAVVNQIRSGASSTQPAAGSANAYLGVQVRNLDSATASRLGLSSTAGALVVGVVASSPAESIGIAADSVITALDGHAVASADALGPLIRAHKSGDSVKVTWIDGSGTHTRTTNLG